MLFNTLIDKGVSVSETLHADKQAIGDEMISGTHSRDGVGLLRLFDLIYSDESVCTTHEQEEVSRSYLTDVLEAFVLRRFFRIKRNGLSFVEASEPLHPDKVTVEVESSLHLLARDVSRDEWFTGLGK